jgi:hypothetical protein
MRDMKSSEAFMSTRMYRVARVEFQVRPFDERVNGGGSHCRTFNFDELHLEAPQQIGSYTFPFYNGLHEGHVCHLYPYDKRSTTTHGYPASVSCSPSTS